MEVIPCDLVAKYKQTKRLNKQKLKSTQKLEDLVKIKITPYYTGKFKSHLDPLYFNIAAPTAFKKTLTHEFGKGPAESKLSGTSPHNKPSRDYHNPIEKIKEYRKPPTKLLNTTSKLGKERTYKSLRQINSEIDSFNTLNKLYHVTPAQYTIHSANVSQTHISTHTHPNAHAHSGKPVQPYKPFNDSAAFILNKDASSFKSIPFSNNQNNVNSHFSNLPYSQSSLPPQNYQRDNLYNMDRVSNPGNGLNKQNLIDPIQSVFQDHPNTQSVFAKDIQNSKFQPLYDDAPYDSQKALQTTNSLPVDNDTNFNHQSTGKIHQKTLGRGNLKAMLDELENLFRDSMQYESQKSSVFDDSDFDHINSTDLQNERLSSNERKEDDVDQELQNS
jgi:hypothetical protein